MGKVLLGAVLLLVIAGGVTYYLLWSGRFPVGATAPADVIDRVAPWALSRALKRETASLSIQIPKDAAARARGLSHYKENCMPCHAAPGIEKSEFAQGLNPSAPELYSPMSQEYTDAELFWITKNGIRMTGMPAFGVNHTDDEIRDIVAFVRRLPEIDDAETAQLRSAETEHHHHEAR